MNKANQKSTKEKDKTSPKLDVKPLGKTSQGIAKTQSSSSQAPGGMQDEGQGNNQRVGNDNVNQSLKSAS